MLHLLLATVSFLVQNVDTREAHNLYWLYILIILPVLLAICFIFYFAKRYYYSNPSDKLTKASITTRSQFYISNSAERTSLSELTASELKASMRSRLTSLNFRVKEADEAIFSRIFSLISNSNKMTFPGNKKIYDFRWNNLKEHVLLEGRK